MKKKYYFLDNPRILIVSLILLFCLTSISTQAQWRTVTPEELQMKAPKVEPDADAEAIFWEVRIDDSSSDELSMRHYVRVKIFSERGREKYSKFDIPFIKGEIKIKDIAARIIKPDGSMVEINQKDIFEREVIKANKVKVKAKSFAVPNIEPGVIVEYRYREVIEDAGAVGMSLEFQKDIPVQNIFYYYKPYDKKEPDYQSFNFKDTKFVKDEKGYYLAQRNNIPAFKEEPRMPPEGMVRPWMQLQGVRLNITSVSAYSIAYSIKDPSNPPKYWAAVSGENAGLVKYMNKPNKEIKRVAAEVAASAATDEEKLQKLYSYVQTQIRNTTFDTTLTDEERQKLPKIKELDDILKYKIASAQFIDMLFGAMANSLGLEARVAFSGNRSKMFFDPGMAVESFIHPAAIAVRVGESWKYYNPGVPFLPQGMLVWYEEGVWAMLTGEKGFTWEQTPLTSIEKSAAKRTAKLKLSEEGTLAGDVRIEYTGQSALANRLDIYEGSPAKREEDFRAELKRRVSAGEVSDVVIENVADASKPLVYSYKINIPNYAQKTGKRMFFQPGFFEYGEEPIFSSKTRKYDIYFTYPWSENDDVEISLPKGFALDSPDRPADIADPQNIGSLKIKIGIDKDQTFMRYSRKFHFGGAGTILFPVAAYQPLKNLFDEFHKSDTHTITLKQN
jgi:hypothetical protein